MSPEMIALLKGLMPFMRAKAATTRTTTDDKLLDLIELAITHPARAMMALAAVQAADEAATQAHKPEKPTKG